MTGLRRAAPLGLPLVYLTVELVLRAHSGPFWVWHVVDPSYFYLLDFLNVLNLETPGHPYHPGTTVQVLGALTIKAAYPFTAADGIIDAVLADPEPHLRLVSTVMLVLNAVALAAAGWLAYAVFGALLPALLLQTGPFLSTLALKNGFHVKPEPLLVLAMVLLAMVTVVALKPGVLERRRYRLAVAFGVVAGFGVATKVTSAPLFLLPVFVLGTVPAIALYGVVSALALVVFTAPAMGAWPVMYEWIVTISRGTGAFGGGEAGFIDFARYPASVVKLFSRPVLHGVFLVSVAALVAGWWRRRRALPVPGPEMRALGGFCLALLAQVLVVAKQPSGHYMIPAFVLAALGMVLLYRTVIGFGVGRRGWTVAFAVLLGVLVVGQGLGVAKLDREFRQRQRLAMAVDDDNFRQCTRIFVLFASNPTYALYLGNFWTAQKLADRLVQGRSPTDFWFHHVSAEVRDWHGPRDPREILEGARCLYIRGSGAHQVVDAFPGLEYETACSTGGETIVTAGVDCDGRITASSSLQKAP